MTSNDNLEPLESTSKDIFNPKKYFERHLASTGKIKPCEHKDPAFMEPINLSLTFGMTSDTYRQPLRILSKPIFDQTRVLPKI